MRITTYAESGETERLILQFIGEYHKAVDNNNLGARDNYLVMARHLRDRLMTPSDFIDNLLTGL